MAEVWPCREVTVELGESLTSEMIEAVAGSKCFQPEVQDFCTCVREELAYGIYKLTFITS